MNLSEAHYDMNHVFEKYKMVNTTFYITYAFLMTTATITFIEALRTKDLYIRNILNLETCISIVATFFYSKFVNEIATGNIDYEGINMTRYTDWAITTPIMLLVLVLALLYNTNKKPLPISSYLWILLFNYGMLGSGYLGEIGKVERLHANTVGFGFFALLFGYIYQQFVHKKYNFDNQVLYWTFVILWSLYGVFYFFTPIPRNVGYNLLDLFSKCFVGIFFWAYFTKVFSMK